jgi:hypothetical protein
LQSNLGIELLGTAIPVFLIDLIVTRYIEKREASRRRPILEVVARQLDVLVGNLARPLHLIDLDIAQDFESADELGRRLEPARLSDDSLP